LPVGEMKMKFHHCWPTHGKMRLATPPGKIHYYLPWKNLSDAHAPLCVDQGFSNFFVHIPLSIKRIIS